MSLDLAPFERSRRRPGCGFVTILCGLRNVLDLLYLLGSLRHAHAEPIVILHAQVPGPLLMPLLGFGEVYLRAAPAHPDPVASSRLAKAALFERSPFARTIYLDADQLVVTSIASLFDRLERADVLVAEDCTPSLAAAEHLTPDGRRAAARLREAGVPALEGMAQRNGGLIAFRRSEGASAFFRLFARYLGRVLARPDLLRARDQGALAVALAEAPARIEILPPLFNFLYAHRHRYAPGGPVRVVHGVQGRRPWEAVRQGGVKWLHVLEEAVRGRGRVRSR